jgi:hypothetical protein
MSNSSKKSWITLVSLLFFICFVVLYLNISYYSGAFLHLAGIGKFALDTQNGLSQSLLAIGRYFYLCILPFGALPSSHYQGAWQNIFGLLILPVFIFFIYKIKNPNKKHLSYSFLLFFFLPLIPVTAKITTIFCSDTYLLTASMGIYFILYINLKEYSQKVLPILAIFSVLLICKDSLYLKAFISDFNIWDYSYHHEASPQSAIFLAYKYTEKKRFKESDALIRLVKEWQPENSSLIEAALRNIYYNSDLPVKVRIKRLELFSPQTALGSLYLSILYSNQNQSIKVREQLPNVLKSPAEYFFYLKGHSNEENIALYLALCEKHAVLNCNESVSKLRHYVHMPFWNEQSFNVYFNKFKNIGPINY